MLVHIETPDSGLLHLNCCPTPHFSGAGATLRKARPVILHLQVDLSSSNCGIFRISSIST